MKEKRKLGLVLGILFLNSSPVMAGGFADKLSKSYIFLGMILLLGFLGLVIEVFNSSFGLGSLVSIFSFSAFFILNASNWGGTSYVSYFIIGLILLLIEIIIPGFTLTGIIGIVLISLSIILTLPNKIYGIIMLLAVLTITISVLFYLFKKGYRSDFIDRLILKETVVEEEKEESETIDYLAREARVVTDMRPSGTIEIDGERLDAISEGIYIKKGEKVVVVKVEGNKITVRRS